MPSATLLDLEPSSIRRVVWRSMCAYNEEPDFVSLIEKEISEDAKKLPQRYLVFFEALMEIVERISPERYIGVSGFENLTKDLCDLIDVCMEITQELREESLQKTEDEDYRWIVSYLARSIRKILIIMKDNLISFYYTNKDSESWRMYQIRVLPYVAKQMIDVLELFALWSDAMGSRSLEIEEILDGIGQRLHASLKSTP